MLAVSKVASIVSFEFSRITNFHIEKMALGNYICICKPSTVVKIVIILMRCLNNLEIDIRGIIFYVNFLLLMRK